MNLLRINNEAWLNINPMYNVHVPDIYTNIEKNRLRFMPLYHCWKFSVEANVRVAFSEWEDDSTPENIIDTYLLEELRGS